MSDGLNVGNYLNSLSSMCHYENIKWWQDPATGEPLANRNKGEMFMLMVTELAEAFEGVRKDLMDAHLPHRKAVEVELADALIRILDYAGAYNMDLGGAFVEKMKYNATRADHTNAARLSEHGKRF